MKIRKIQDKILSWYQQNKRDLPWRKTQDPYAILISEVMLQQTQVERVIPYYKKWMQTFPNFRSLANANATTLLEHWSGLGYNSRALRLQKCAQEIVEKYNNKFPTTEEELLQLPGIGPYTAHAVLAFAFNKKVPVMDTNIRRVLIHELELEESIPLDDLKTIALQLVPKNTSCIWHNALMDYGALYKTARKTGIKSLTTQTKFEGSTRQIRGAIVKLLLKEKKVSLKRIKKDFFHPELSAILSKMEKEEIIKVHKGIIAFC